MNALRSDTTLARNRLREHGWIDRRVESFRHLPPPAVDAWLGEAGGAETATAPSTADWSVESAGSKSPAVVARWLDALIASERAELFAGLPLPDAGETAPFAWAHRALCRGGLHLQIGAADRDQPVMVHLRHRAAAGASAPLLIVQVAAGAQGVLSESHERAEDDGPGVVQNLQVHVELGEGATLRHLRIALPGSHDRVAHRVHARLGHGARYEQALVATGSAYHLQRSDVELPAAGATVSLASVACAAAGALDRQARVSHAAPDTTSAVEQLALAGAGAHIVLNADTRIAPGADEARVRQHLTAIPTGGQPKVVLRPHLEILHDKVEANHGATWGALPADALFYARQRGLDEPLARALIVEGMAAAVLARGFSDTQLLETLAVERLLARVVARQLGGSTKESAHA